MDIDTIRSKYEADRPRFVRLAEVAAEQIRRAGADERLTFHVEHRAKEMRSLLKKVIFGKSDYRRIIDRAGIRLVLDSAQDLDHVERVIQRVFIVSKKIDISAKLGEKEFGYSGVHFYAELRDPSDENLSGLKFECQVHTRAQSLWASLSHALAYKTESTGPHIRALTRLAALLEVVDLEIARIREDATGSPGWVATQVAEVLEAHYMAVGRLPHSRETTTMVLPGLLSLMGTEDFEAWRDDFEAFAQDHSDRLREIYDRYRDDTRHLLISQPESLLVLYARARDPYSFTDRWPEELGDDLRDAFVGIWPNP